MVTTEDFDKLKKLQSILVKKYALEESVKEAPKQLTSQEELLARLKKEYIEKNADYDVIKQKVLTLKAELEEAVKSRESGEKGMDNITTHREYEALEKQISEATEKENEVRKELQKEEKTLAELKENLKNYEDSISDLENDLNTNKASLDNQINDYKAQLDDLTAKENEIKIDQEILFKFQRIIQRNDEGIVMVKNGVCTGCHMILPAQFANTVKKGDSIIFCPYCSRILYYEETAEDEAEENYFNIGVAGSLADFDDEEFDDDEFESADDETDAYGEDEDMDSSEDENADVDEDADDSSDDED